MDRDWDWLIATGGLIALFFLLLGYFIGIEFEGNEIKNDFITCGLGATCPSTHSTKYIGWECIECTYEDGERTFDYNLSTICQEYKQNIVARFENLKDKAVNMAEAQGENCSNLSWQECLYNKGEGIKFIYGNNSEDMYCYTIPSPPKCDYIELKNGTLIPKGSCIMTFNYIMKCINKSEIKGMITK